MLLVITEGSISTVIEWFIIVRLALIPILFITNWVSILEANKWTSWTSEIGDNPFINYIEPIERLWIEVIFFYCWIVNGSILLSSLIFNMIMHLPIFCGWIFHVIMSFVFSSWILDTLLTSRCTLYHLTKWFNISTRFNFNHDWKPCMVCFLLTF